jgi:hypothetical protein
MKLTLIIRFLFVSLLGLATLSVRSASAAPIPPPPSLTPPIPSNATGAHCDQTSIGITCNYTIHFSFGGPAFVNCGKFLIADSGSGVREVTRYYDLSGALLEEVRHIDYTSTEFNASQPANTATRVGHFALTLDYQAGMPALVTYTGLTTQIVVPGQGVVGLDAGRVAINPVTNTLVSASGRHDFIFPQAPGVAPNTQQLCGALR